MKDCKQFSASSSNFDEKEISEMKKKNLKKFNNFENNCNV